MKRRVSLRLALNQICNKKKENKNMCVFDFKLCVLLYRAKTTTTFLQNCDIQTDNIKYPNIILLLPDIYMIHNVFRKNEKGFL